MGAWSPEVRLFLIRAVTYIGDDCLIWPFHRDRQGYGRINRKTYGEALPHRYVCRVSHGPPPSATHQAAHLCGNGHLGCVNPNHLSWKTPAENCADAITHGTTQRGERSAMAKLTEADVIYIRTLRGLVPQKELAQQFGVHPKHISRLQCAKRWAHLPEDRIS